jgi:hypothetical protein
MRNLERRLTGLVLGAALVLGVAACNNDTAAPEQSILSKAQADSLAQVLTADVDAMVQGASVSNSDVVAVPSTAVDLGDRLGARCVPARSPESPTNSDTDPVVDSVRLDFSGCVISTPRAAITYSGTIDIIDPTPTETDHAVKTVYTDFTRSTTELGSGRTTSVEQNGTRLFLRNASTVQHSESDFRTDVTFPDGSTASHVKDWSSTFTADVPGSITRGPLPSGTWDITGNSTWTRGDRSHSLTVSTDPDLHYNASCTVGPKFDAGKLTAVVTRRGTTSTVTIEFTACGQYTVTRS